MSIADVIALYEQERAELAKTANLEKFVQLFAIRNVQGILRARSRTQALPKELTSHLAMRQGGRGLAVA